MQLDNPFPLKVRLLYLDCWVCFICGKNGQDSGGLEIHHILGRISSVAFNSSCLCKECHAHIGHSIEEEQNIFFSTLKYLYDIDYQPTQEDYKFLHRNYKRLWSEKAEQWLLKK